MLDCMKRLWSLFPSKLKVNTASSLNCHLRIPNYCNKRGRGVYILLFLSLTVYTIVHSRKFKTKSTQTLQFVQFAFPINLWSVTVRMSTVQRFIISPAENINRFLSFVREKSSIDRIFFKNEKFDLSWRYNNDCVRTG